MIRKVLFSIIKPKTHSYIYQNVSKFSTNQNKPSQPEKQPQKQQINQNKDATHQTSSNKQTNNQTSQKVNRQSESQYEEDIVYEKENRNTLGWWIYRFFVWGTIGIFTHQIYLTATHNKKTPVQNEPTAIPYAINVAKHIYKQYNDLSSFLWNPPVTKFLPDPIHPSMQGKTLVLNLTGTLLKTDFVFGKGLTMKRRPGLNNLLKRLQQKYQIIIYTDDDYMFVTTAVEYLDPRQQIFMGAFGKQSMVLSQGHYTKDLRYLNRDLKNVIVIDKNIKNINKFPQNGIILKQFDGDQKDNELIKLLPLLQYLANPQVTDIRKVLKGLGQNPHEKYYQRLKQKQNAIAKRTGFAGFFSKSNQPTQKK